MPRIPRNVTIQDITRILTFLGFEFQRKSNHTRFYHPETRTSIVLPVRERYIRVAYLSYMRKIIDERGIADKEEFDDLLNNF